MSLESEGLPPRVDGSERLDPLRFPARLIRELIRNPLEYTFIMTEGAPEWNI